MKHFAAIILFYVVGYFFVCWAQNELLKNATLGFFPQIIFGTFCRLNVQWINLKYNYSSAAQKGVIGSCVPCVIDLDTLCVSLLTVSAVLHSFVLHLYSVHVSTGSNMLIKRTFYWLNMTHLYHVVHLSQFMWFSSMT